MMNKIAFLSMDSLAEFCVYDDLLIAPFAEFGIEVVTVSWHDHGVDYRQFDAVIVRSPWDYQQHEAAFVACLRRIASATRLINPLPLLLWNLNKKYLKELTRAGVATLPTLWCEDFVYSEVLAAFNTFACDEIVLKPCVSANADDTFRLTPADLVHQRRALASCFKQREFMIQPFIHSVVEHGEISLFYFAGELSHGILKQPKSGDFRVQEEHGGRLQAITPSAQMQHSATLALAAMPSDYLYARVDLLWFDEQWRVIELELIEPSLYFNLCSQSPQCFVAAYQRYVQP